MSAAPGPVDPSYPPWRPGDLRRRRAGARTAARGDRAGPGRRRGDAGRAGRRGRCRAAQGARCAARGDPPLRQEAGSQSAETIEKSLRKIDERTRKAGATPGRIRARPPLRRVADPHQHRGDARRPSPRGPRDRRPFDRIVKQAARSFRLPRYSVEMLGSAWTLCGTTIRKLLAASAASLRTRSASSS